MSLRLRSSSRAGTTLSLLSTFSDSNNSIRLQSTLTLYRYKLGCLLTLSHVLVLQTSMLQTGGVTSQVVSATTGPVAMTCLVRVVLVQPVLHAQMMRMLVEMKMMMSDHNFQRQLAAPFVLSMSLLDLCGDR